MGLFLTSTDHRQNGRTCVTSRHCVVSNMLLHGHSWSKDVRNIHPFQHPWYRWKLHSILEVQWNLHHIWSTCADKRLVFSLHSYVHRRQNTILSSVTPQTHITQKCTPMYRGLATLQQLCLFEIIFVSICLWPC